MYPRHFPALNRERGFAKLGGTSCSQVRRKLIFCPARGASRRIDNDTLRRSHTRSDDGSAITADVIRVAATAEQRFAALGCAWIASVRWLARDLQRDRRHNLAPLCSRELVFAHNAFMAVE